MSAKLAIACSIYMPAWEWEAGWWVCAMPHMIKCRCFVVHAYTLPSDQKSMSTRYGLMDLDMPPTRTGFPPTATALSFMCYVRIDISIIVDFKNFALLGPFPLSLRRPFFGTTLNSEFRELVQVHQDSESCTSFKFTTRRAFVNALVIKAWDTQVKTCTPGGQRRPMENPRDPCLKALL